ncbi:hypothetical protein ACVBAX_06960 [Robertmurraya sp. GLU-23]|jgi:hypothetical protein|nr:hypothetical protein [Bacillus sp. Y1]
MMADERPIEYSGKVLDERNTLTGPDKGKNGFPKTPKNVPIRNNQKQS